jgi:integrase
VKPSLSIAKAVDFYLETRRSLGFALVGEGRLLRSLADYVQHIRHRGPLTADLVLAWARLPAQAEPLWWARRLEAAQRLARFWQAFDPRTQIPPSGVFGPAYGRPQPHLYTPEELSNLLHSASTLAPSGSLRSLTFQTLLGLLACTGLRISEALHLRLQDFDVVTGTITVHRSKFGQSRCLPLSLDAVAALQAYQRARRKHHPHTNTPNLFLNLHGQALSYSQAAKTFRLLRRQLRWSQQPLPRLHDLRHTFTVTRLLNWYRQGEERVNQKILALATYLGHRNIRHTYWYLSALPELLALATTRLANTPAKETSA